MLNQCTLTGNLGGDPKVFYSSEGKPSSIILSGLPFIKEENWMDQGGMLPKTVRSHPEASPQRSQNCRNWHPGSSQMGNGRRNSEELFSVDCQQPGIYQNRRERVRGGQNRRGYSILRLKERGMKRKTIQLIITILAFATEVLAVIKEKINGRKGNDDNKGNTEKK